MSVDPIAALRVWSIAVEVNDQTFTIPPLPAADWLETILATDRPLPVIPGMLPLQEQDVLYDWLLDGHVEVEDLIRVSRDALEMAAGRKWWEADRLIRSSAEQWHIIGGELTRLNIDLERASIAAVLNAIYVICVRNMDDKQRSQFDIDLRRPPLGVDGEESYDARAAENAFLALMGQAQPPTP